MNYSNYSAMVAAEVRESWNKEWDAKVVGSRKFVGLGLDEKTIYCVKGLRGAAFTITDRSTGLIIDCVTIEQARVEFSNVQTRLLASGYWKVAR